LNHNARNEKCKITLISDVGIIVETYPRLTNGRCSDSDVYGRYLCDCHKLTWPSNKVVLRDLVVEISTQNQRGFKDGDLCRFLKSICINMCASPNINVS